MAWVIVGLGNPGEEYESTRHNVGRMVLDYFAKKHAFSDWRDDKKAKARVSRGVLDRTIVALVEPDTFMNKSGSAVVKFVKSVKAAERMVVVYDDLDLPLGRIKLSFDRGSGGHKGVESVMRGVKTKKFVRIRVGVSPHTAGGKLKKPSGEEVVIDFILARFKQSELADLNVSIKHANDALEMIIKDSYPNAMNFYNQG
jgi:peptidyl-tRNA hydrolase, PTH1 family